MYILKLDPEGKDYLWGGTKLKEQFGKKYNGEKLAETWELSCHPDGLSKIANGEFAGKTLREYIEICGKDVLGTNCYRFEEFPILVKLIDARDNLSIQVHPNNEYALKNEGGYGKTEVWYIVDCGENASLYYGLNREISKAEFADRIQNNTILEVLNQVSVKKGDVFFIEAGTIHAIGKDILIAEIQQNSNSTYRVYDFDRRDKDGNARELHVEKAVDVTDMKPAVPVNMHPHIADCEYFTVDKINLDGKMLTKLEGNVSSDTFQSLLVLEGNGTIKCDENKIEFSRGDCLFMPAGLGEYKLKGAFEALLISVRA